uniref:Uncharacterized protein n=1 Tax=Branchiostoma floridae TaxID=7739 RepID=C3ZZB0_BRAFL|eukprot:XP_002586103.1 hypothetical protein BRAFLDRAFT_110005 [Branchiostoma floridae]
MSQTPRVPTGGQLPSRTQQLPRVAAPQPVAQVASGIPVQQQQQAPPQAPAAQQQALPAQQQGLPAQQQALTAQQQHAPQAPQAAQQAPQAAQQAPQAAQQALPAQQVQGAQQQVVQGQVAGGQNQQTQQSFTPDIHEFEMRFPMDPFSAYQEYLRRKVGWITRKRDGRVEIPPAVIDVSRGKVHASADSLMFRDPDCFIAGEIHKHPEVWRDIVKGTDQEEMVLPAHLRPEADVYHPLLLYDGLLGYLESHPRRQIASD